MNLFLRRTAILISAVIISMNVFAVNYITWKFNNLSTIGGNSVTTEGDPTLITINNDSACYFDGTEDRFVFSDCPIDTYAGDFTIETIFRVDGGDEQEQKFIHIQADNDARILFELEFEANGTWRMETYVKALDGSDIHLIDSNAYFKPNRWYHAALVYNSSTNEFKQYINYTGINSQSLTWGQVSNANISVGARATQENYLTGAVRSIRYADAALDSNEFLLYGELLDDNDLFILDNLESLNGYDVTVNGNPTVVETEIGPGIEFDGSDEGVKDNGDGIYINYNPLDSSKYFTIETIFKPNDVYPDNADPRYLHIEDADDNTRRLTMELRLDELHNWYFDGFIRAGSVSLGHMDEDLVHPVKGWEHAAVTYNDGKFTTYVDYQQELDSNWVYKLLPFGDNTKMSLGMRQNKVNYFNGIIQRVRITRSVLDISEFMEIYDTGGGETGFDEILSENIVDLNVSVYPNPSNGYTTIKLVNSKAGLTSIALYNMAGLKMDELMNEFISEGVVTTNFDAGMYPKGLYLIQVRNNNDIITQKLMAR